MRRVLDEQTYLNFNQETSLKVVRDYRAKYEWIDECLGANPRILWLVHADLEGLSKSKEGREAKYTTEILFRALIVHQMEKTSLRDTIIRIAESPTLQAFICLGPRSAPDFTFLNRAFKAITAETWKLVNEELAGYAVKECDLDVSRIRVDSTVIENNIHYPTDSSLLWDSYRVLSRLLRRVRAEAPELCPHRFHDKKAKKDLVYVNRYMRSGSTARKREAKRRFRRLHDAVCRLRSLAQPLPKTLMHSGNHEAMEEKIDDTELLEDITLRHKASFRKYPDGITADTGFRAVPEERAKVEKNVGTVAVPGRGQSRAKIDACWHHFRAGIEGSISVLKRAFRLSICMYRGFKSFAAAVGMAVFCHNLLNLAPKRAPA